MKIVISENQFKQLKKSINEEISPKELYSVFVGFLAYVSEDMGSNKSVEEMAALKNLRVHYEKLRDGQPSQLPSSYDNLIKWVESEIKKLNAQQIKSMRDKGLNIQTI